MCGVCASVCKCARVCAGVCRSSRVCTGVRKWAQVAQVYTGVCVCVWKCMGVCECVCGMNSQNIYWRIESLQQRTLIRILYEFFFLDSDSKCSFHSMIHETFYL